MNSKLLYESKIWFVNVVLLLMWVVAILLDVLPMVHINDDTVKIALFALTGTIPAVFIAELVGLWKKFHVYVDIKNNGIDKTEEEKKDTN